MNSFISTKEASQDKLQGQTEWRVAADDVRCNIQIHLFRTLSACSISPTRSGGIIRAVSIASPGRKAPRTLPGRSFSLPIQDFLITPLSIMAKTLTKSQITTSLAETVGVTRKQAAETLEALVVLAYKNARNKFTIPGLGKLVLVNRKARMGRNPATGESIKIPAKRVVKFRIAKAAKDAILGTK